MECLVVTCLAGTLEEASIQCTWQTLDEALVRRFPARVFVALPCREDREVRHPAARPDCWVAQALPLKGDPPVMRRACSAISSETRHTA